MITLRASIDVSDLEALGRTLNSQQIRSVLLKSIRVALNPTIRLARALAPRGRTGKLARSIRTAIRTRRGLEVAIAGVPYAHLVEYGHRLVRGGRVLRSTSKNVRRVNGVFVGPRGGRYTGRVIGFVQPKPFVRPAVESTLTTMEQTVAHDVDRALQTAINPIAAHAL
jgi:bacteriophage HK97-gp10 putative tail-component